MPPGIAGWRIPADPAGQPVLLRVINPDSGAIFEVRPQGQDPRVRFSPELAEIRFGCGLSPERAAPVSVDAIIGALSQPDTMAERFPIQTFSEYLPRLAVYGMAARKARKARGTPEFGALRKEVRSIKRSAAKDETRWMGQVLLRWTWTDQGFRERLAGFWGDHFTAPGKNALMLRGGQTYVEEAIRPHVGGRFADMLYAAVTNPLMLHALDQQSSVGPSSPAAVKRGKGQGLNENLAREVMELHTLGVDGPYSQQDVRQLAELFTGMMFRPKHGFLFNPALAEPGTEQVLGRSYGGDPATMDHIRAALDDLAAHPATARHLAWKLAVHFVSDTPEPDLVDHVAARYLAANGHLTEVYAALLEHPAAWEPELRNVKPAADFVGSACRALAVHPMVIQKMSYKHMRARFQVPMVQMGQTWQRPKGPDGWPEEDTAWITPQNLSARVRWAMAVPRKLRSPIPDPREFAEQSLGARLSGAVRFAARSAETRPEGIGLVLASPDFQRR